MDILTASILSGIIYDAVKSGGVISFDMLKSKLQGWIIDDAQINKMAVQLKDAGINEDLGSHAIERKIKEHQPLLDLIEHIRHSDNSVRVTQSSEIGHNISNSGSGHISVGGITATKSD